MEKIDRPQVTTSKLQIAANRTNVTLYEIINGQNQMNNRLDTLSQRIAQALAKFNENKEYEVPRAVHVKRLNNFRAKRRTF